MLDFAFAMRRSGPAVWFWIGFVAVASILLSRAFACATPFAALATLAAFTLRGREAITLVILVWAANQAVGFGLLRYPMDASTIAWGVAIGVAALGALAAAWMTVSLANLARSLAVILGLLAAYATYEGILVATTWILPSGSGAFSPMVIARIFAINVAALGLLLAASRVAETIHAPTRSRLIGGRR